MKRLLFLLLLLPALVFAETTITLVVDGDPVHTVTVTDDAVVTVEKTPVVETVVIPINP